MGEVAKGVLVIGLLAFLLGLHVLFLAVLGRREFGSVREWWSS